MTAAAADKKKLPLHWKMGIGFAIGLILGLIVHALGGSVDGLQAGAKWVMDYITTPASGLFLNLIFMLIVPLIFSALIMGVSEMGDIRALRRIGWKALAYTERRAQQGDCRGHPRYAEGHGHAAVDRAEQRAAGRV